MSLDVAAIEAEVLRVVGESQATWGDFAGFLKIKIFEAGLNGGITSYTINGRTVTKDKDWLKEAYKFAVNQQNIEDTGGIMGCPISFRRPT